MIEDYENWKKNLIETKIDNLLTNNISCLNYQKKLSEKSEDLEKIINLIEIFFSYFWLLS